MTFARASSRKDLGDAATMTSSPSMVLMKSLPSAAI